MRDMFVGAVFFADGCHGGDGCDGCGGSSFFVGGGGGGIVVGVDASLVRVVVDGVDWLLLSYCPCR